ncbi:CRISPR-associated protein Cse4 [Acetobacter malorum DSM 14337]|uniref:CRISPR-associated protein Cse4 n=1 Tax=Acetobacter malorum DSM 14337 TaxID=1307910 RepID=A0ABQ0Q008_9PROT|nr:type I-E CRISPR-associated protein Cas7/Cse4/CasC [Acetobacter malorum]KXV05745.1 CRISPR-associated protein Cse4 [Acetobacter malorum]GBQ85815.1 CRISPR-associated protein Cse4 [Acetobacter malorum DSM 14337]
MTKFVQFHLLTSFGPSNPNRDDQGRPKQAMVGGAPRLRMSSQSIKRALRGCSRFALDLAEHMGTRTKRLPEKLTAHLVAQGATEEKARQVAEKVASVFGKLESTPRSGDGKVLTTLAFISPDEWAYATQLAEAVANGDPLPTDKELKKTVLRRADGAIDIAMFGRMLADDSGYNREAAVQVSHAITTHRAQSEEDYFSAVDDLNQEAGETGAGHIGEAEFGSGVYYEYVCVNLDLLEKNLDGNKELAARGIEALVRGLSQVTPSGKQNSFANHPRAHYILAECGEQAPRDLSGAFFDAVTAKPLMEKSVLALEKTREDIEAAYGKSCDKSCVLHVGQSGTLEDIVAFVGSAVRGG